MRAMLILGLGLLVACTAPAQGPASQPAAASAPPAAATSSAPQAPTAGQTSAAMSPAANPVTVRVGAPIGASDAAILLAIEHGYFAAQGLEVELSRGAGSDHIAAVATGDLEVVGGA